MDRPGQAYQNRLWAHSVGPRQSAWASCDLEIACRTKPKVWRHVQSLLQLWCPEQVGSKKNKHFPLVSKRTAGPRLQADSDRQHVQTLPVETWALLEEKKYHTTFYSEGDRHKVFFSFQQVGGPEADLFYGTTFLRLWGERENAAFGGALRHGAVVSTRVGL